MSSHCGICSGQGHREESCDYKPKKESMKTLKEVIDFLNLKIEESVEAERWTDGSAYSLIKQYIDNNSTALTPEELKLLKKDVVNNPVKKSELNSLEERTLEEREDGDG